jgi:hypothetical protein
MILQQLKSPCPYYLNDDRKNTILVLGTCLLLVAFMITFHPANLRMLPKVLTVGAVTFVVLFCHIVLLPKLFPATFDSLHWTLGKYLLFTVWQILVCGPAIATVVYLLRLHPNPPVTLGESILAMYPRILTYGSVPIAIATLVLRTYTLKENLRSAMQANQELEKIRTLKDEKKDYTDQPDGHTSHLLTVYSDTRETITLNMPDLLYIEASDNYSTVFWKNGTGIEKKILRINLKNMETQLNNSFALRCHRSFIVNIYAIAHISGNTNGYRLNIRDTDFSVPVSRSKGKEVIGKLRQLRDMIELY